ncbi:ArsR/SmtB family transcription factor [Candidatus Solincola sp.]|nr:metalloregulator ArsR/SmtB family transcription factor [Actinomycetota bacterium]MDI7253072.1 metalloregulator ArsR/SmtB family transcription factor [Actinomycetota bacterium]
MPGRKKLRCVEDPGILELAEGLKVLADPNRLRILCLLLRGERCVCEVERELGISQQLASHHLNVLKEAGFLVSRKEGTSSYYAVVAGKVEDLLEVMRRHLTLEGEDEAAAVSCCANAPASQEGENGETVERFHVGAGRGNVKTRGGSGR